MIAWIWNENWFAILLTGGFLLAYRFYYKKFRYYSFTLDKRVTDPVKLCTPRGKCPPFFPNGWFRVLHSNELQRDEVKYLDYCGRDIIVFRTQEDRVFALNAYCSHMGANLGVGGKVKGNCIECPFHGWLFDGATGKSVVSHKSPMIDKVCTQYEYAGGVKNARSCDGAYLQKVYEGSTKLKKYNVREHNRGIYVWFHSRDDQQDTQPFEPFEFDTGGLEFRGESLNYVNCHIQEVPENGADLRHFDFVHKRLFAWLTWVEADWTMTSVRASDPQLHEKMRHKKDYINDFKQKLLNKYITEKNKRYVNVISLDMHIVIFGWRLFCFNSTAFQVGPGLVYLFMKSPIMEFTLAQSITILDKMHTRVSHLLYAKRYMPYWVTAVMLYLESQQVYNDTKLWDRKIFGSKLTYNMKTEADRNLKEWRDWYYQFYDGCDEFEQSRNALNW